MVVVLGALTLLSTVLALAQPGPEAEAARPVTDTASGSSLDAYLTVLARDLTGRGPTLALRSFWSRQLAGGTSRAKLTDLVSRTDFAADLQVRAAYAQVL